MPAFDFTTPPIVEDIRAPEGQQIDPYLAESYDTQGVLRVATLNDAGEARLDGNLIFTAPGALNLGLAFDQSDSPLVCYELAGSIWLHWFDPVPSQIVQTEFAVGASPRIDLDFNDGRVGSQAVLSYIRGGVVYYRTSPERFATEFTVPVISGVQYLEAAARSSGNRFLFIALGDTTGQLESSFSGIVLAGGAALVEPFRVNFFRVLKHLLPRARAWRITIDKTLRRTIKGLSTIGEGVKAEADAAFSDIDPQTTRRLADWEKQFNLRAGSLTEQQRRDRLEATWSAKGSLAPRNLENLLQGLGFDVYVHDWWVPGTEPAINSHAAATVRNPFLYLAASNNTGTTGTDCGDTLMECGEEFAECGNSNTPSGYPLVNKVRVTTPDDVTGCGEPDMECGEARAECGDFNQIIDRYREYQLPVDPATWSGFVYIGGETFPDLATVPLSRRDEFEAALLKYCPAHQWIGVLVTYS